ncbi:hypothetical protein D3C71_318360 [compost metagenome]
MRDFLWRLRAALAYRRLACLDWRTAWSCASTLLDNGIDESPAAAVREDLTYWGD